MFFLLALTRLPQTTSGRDFDRFSRFCAMIVRVTNTRTDRQTDRQTNETTQLHQDMHMNSPRL